jgi:ribosome-associated translation inhibitor RaiA
MPVQITFRGTDPSPAVEESVQAEAARLRELCDRIQKCHVIIEAPGFERHRKGRRFRVLIDMTLPGVELVAGRHQPEDLPPDDVHAAISDAFLHARRELETHLARKQRHR